jgi:predicted DNA-binding antitoxin AbrB/MazE fold protein
MTIHVDAIYEQGAFRPAAPVALQEGARVVLTIETEVPLRPPGRLVAALAEIAAMPAEGADDGFSGADHDNVLYGSEGAR